ncbi:hypothetical protein Tco_1482561, partial [Tanacetum coccineum]
MEILFIEDSVLGPPKRVRGHTRKQAIWDFEPRERFTITFDECGQPVGKEAKELTSFLGTVAKMSQHIDIGITDWRKISKDKKDDLWSIVKEKFEFALVETEEIRFLTVDEIVATQTDTRVEKEDFKKLITHWFCEDTQAQFRRTSLTEFPARSVRSSNAIELDSPYLLILITVDTSLIYVESRKSPTAELFDVDSGRISIHH